MYVNLVNELLTLFCLQYWLSSCHIRFWLQKLYIVPNEGGK